jgi:hypothetical protein
MRAWFVVLVAAALAGAQESAPERDLATLFPVATPIYAELDAISPAAESLRDTVLMSLLDPPAREKLDLVLADVAAAKLDGRAAIGVLPALIMANRWIIVAECETPDRIVAAIRKRASDPKLRPATAEIPPLCVVADSDATIDMVTALRDGKAKPLAGREDFKRYRAQARRGVVRFHVDVKELAPRILRFGLDKKDDVGAVLLAHRFTHVAKTARTVSGSLDLVDGALLEVVSEIDPVPQVEAFTETRPTQPVLLPPDGCALRISLPRDLQQFWNERKTLLSDKARAPLAEFQNNLAILMGGLAVEDVFAGLGSAFDLYVGRGGAQAVEGQRYPSVALVAIVRDPALTTSFLLSFQTTIGIVNAQRSMEGQPRFFQDSTRHRDVLIASARLLPESVPDPSDQRLQFEPSLAIAGDRLIFGTNRATVASLVDRVLDGKTAPRAAAEESALLGGPAAVLLSDASALLRSKMVLGSGRSEEDAQKTIDAVRTALLAIDTARGTFDIEGGLATMEIRIAARRLLKKIGEGR